MNRPRSACWERKRRNMKEDDLLRRRFEDLAKQSYNGNRYTNTGFLDAAQQAVYRQMREELSYASAGLYGGYEGSERNMLRFGSAETTGYEEPYPVVCVAAEPVARKFADDLNHRDFLGALMNLGIQRNMLGDILIRDNCGYIFCVEQMADYISEHLNRVKHTSVKCRVTREMPEAAKPVPEQVRLNVSSNRCDSIVAQLYHLSRTQSLALFRGQKVSVNGRLHENNSGPLKPGDTVSVRGRGKFVYYGDERETKKGRLSVAVGRYV